MEAISHTHKTSEFHTLLSRICKSAAELLRADAASVYIKEEDYFVMRAGWGYSYDLVGKAKYKSGEGITGWIGQGHSFKADSREEVESHPHHAGKYDANLWAQPSFHCWSLIGVPLYLGTQVLGLIKVENKKSEGEQTAFTDEDLENLKIFVRAITDSIQANDELLHMLGRLYVFVVIPFQDRFRNIYEFGIKQVVEGTGMICERVDEIEFNDDILRRIYECIRKADLIIAELTEKNPNVFYETGYAHALAKPTIHLAQNAERPFDFKHFNHIIYDSNNIPDLQARLKKRLLAMRQQIIKRERTES